MIRCSATPARAAVVAKPERSECALNSGSCNPTTCAASAERDLGTNCRNPEGGRPNTTPPDLDTTPPFQRDEWLVGRGYLSAESISLVLAERADHTDKVIKEEQGQLQAARA